ncbi:MAG: hypothetical protein QXG32_00290 [Candidatus Bathyarchaeia archaeon]
MGSGDQIAPISLKRIGIAVAPHMANMVPIIHPKLLDASALSRAISDLNWPISPFNSDPAPLISALNSALRSAKFLFVATSAHGLELMREGLRGAPMARRIAQNPLR